MDISTISDKIFQIGKLGKLPSFILGNICLTFILIPTNVSDLLGITEIINSNRPYFGLGAIFFPIYLISFIAYEFLCGYLSRRIVIIRMKRQLRKLANDEKDVLRPFIEENKRTMKFKESDGIASGLVAKKILYRPSILASHQNIYAYSIQDYAFEYLKKNIYLLEK